MSSLHGAQITRETRTQRIKTLALVSSLLQVPPPLFFPPLGFKTLCLACLTYCTPKFITHHDYSISQSQLGKFLSRHAMRKETLPSWIQIRDFVGTSGPWRCQFPFFSVLTALSEKTSLFSQTTEGNQGTIHFNTPHRSIPLNYDLAPLSLVLRTHLVFVTWVFSNRYQLWAAGRKDTFQPITFSFYTLLFSPEHFMHLLLEIFQ